LGSPVSCKDIIISQTVLKPAPWSACATGCQQAAVWLRLHSAGLKSIFK